MDPLSVTASVAGILGGLATVADRVSTLKQNYDHAEFYITQTASLLFSVQRALEALETLRTSEALARSTAGQQLDEDLTLPLESCAVLIALIERQLEGLDIENPSRIDKFRFVGLKETFMQAERSLGTQVTALQLLISIYQCGTLAERTKPLNRSYTQRALRDVVENTASLVLDEKDLDDAASILSKDPSVNFTFDHEILQTKQYKAVYKDLYLRYKPASVKSSVFSPRVSTIFSDDRETAKILPALPPRPDTKEPPITEVQSIFEKATSGTASVTERQRPLSATGRGRGSTLSPPANKPRHSRQRSASSVHSPIDPLIGALPQLPFLGIPFQGEVDTDVPPSSDEETSDDAAYAKSNESPTKVETVINHEKSTTTPVLPLSTSTTPPVEPIAIISAGEPGQNKPVDLDKPGSTEESGHESSSAIAPENPEPIEQKPDPIPTILEPDQVKSTGPLYDILTNDNESDLYGVSDDDEPSPKPSAINSETKAEGSTSTTEMSKAPTPEPQTSPKIAAHIKDSSRDDEDPMSDEANELKRLTKAVRTARQNQRLAESQSESPSLSVSSAPKSPLPVIKAESTGAHEPALQIDFGQQPGLGLSLPEETEQPKIEEPVSSTTPTMPNRLPPPIPSSRPSSSASETGPPLPPRPSFTNLRDPSVVDYQEVRDHTSTQNQMEASDLMPQKPPAEDTVTARAPIQTPTNTTTAIAGFGTIPSPSSAAGSFPSPNPSLPKSPASTVTPLESTDPRVKGIPRRRAPPPPPPKRLPKPSPASPPGEGFVDQSRARSQDQQSGLIVAGSDEAIQSRPSPRLEQQSPRIASVYRTPQPVQSDDASTISASIAPSRDSASMFRDNASIGSQTVNTTLLSVPAHRKYEDTVATVDFGGTGGLVPLSVSDNAQKKSSIMRTLQRSKGSNDSTQKTAVRYKPSMSRLSFFGGENAAKKTFHEAAVVGNLSKLQEYLGEKSKLINSLEKLDSDKVPKTAMMRAAAGNHVACVEALALNGADYGIADKEGKIAMHYAIENQAIQCVRFLAERFHAVMAPSGQSNVVGALEFQGPLGLRPLHMAAATGNVELIDILIRSGARVDSCDRAGRTPLNSALQAMHFEAFKLLLERGSSVRAFDYARRSVLMWATEANAQKAVKYLLELRVDRYATDAEGNQAVHIAAEKGHVTILEFLYLKIADFEAQNLNGERPLHLAAGAGQARAAKALLKVGCTPLCYTTGNRKGQSRKKSAASWKDLAATPLHYACAAGADNVAESLVYDGCSAGGGVAPSKLVNANQEDGTSPLMLAAQARSFPITRLLLENGADPNAKTAVERMTALHYAARADDLESTQLLARNGAEMSARSKRGQIPYSYGCDNGKSPNDTTAWLSKHSLLQARKAREALQPDRSEQQLRQNEVNAQAQAFAQYQNPLGYGINPATPGSIPAAGGTLVWVPYSQAAGAAAMQPLPANVNSRHPLTYYHSGTRTEEGVEPPPAYSPRQNNNR